MNSYIYSFVFFKYNNKDYIISIDGQYLLSFSKNFNKLNPYIFDIYFDKYNKNIKMIFNNKSYIIPKNFDYNDKKNILEYFKIKPKIINKEEFNIINDIIYNLN